MPRTRFGSFATLFLTLPFRPQFSKSSMQNYGFRVSKFLLGAYFWSHLDIFDSVLLCRIKVAASFFLPSTNTTLGLVEFPLIVHIRYLPVIGRPPFPFSDWHRRKIVNVVVHDIRRSLATKIYNNNKKQPTRFILIESQLICHKISLKYAWCWRLLSGTAASFYVFFSSLASFCMAAATKKKRCHFVLPLLLHVHLFYLFFFSCVCGKHCSLSRGMSIHKRQLTDRINNAMQINARMSTGRRMTMPGGRWRRN